MKKKLMRTIYIVVGLPLFLFLALLLFLTVTEYKPEEIETIEISGSPETFLSKDDAIKLMTFNIGYASLGENEDFVMDGGERGRPESKDVVLDYLAGIESLLEMHESDVYFLQEVDEPSRRSYDIDQVERLHDTLGETQYLSTYAYNFKASFVPFPVSLTEHIGDVSSGMQTLSRYMMDDSVRMQFPGEFSWPLRTANLKRAMIVSRVPLEDSEQELILINLHMSAYDDGSMREQEMELFREVLQEERDLGNYVIAGGDFNQTFPEAEGLYPIIDDEYFTAPQMEEGVLGEGFDFAVDLDHPTSRLLNMPYDPSNDATQYYIIDGFVVSDNVRVLSVETINHAFEYSDHNPVILEAELISE
ncbi:MAG: endonuclease/exonuclease/phosphatase family protein [Bacillota bacterium]